MPDNLHFITTFNDLLDWLGDELDWPIEDYGLDDLTFEYDADDLGLREEEAEKLEGSSIRQLRPLTGGQPFGIFSSSSAGLVSPSSSCAASSTPSSLRSALRPTPPTSGVGTQLI